MEPTETIIDRATRTLRRLKNTAMRQEREFDGLSTKDVFEKIYSEGRWGESPTGRHRFSSGPGSHDPSLVEPYVAAVGDFLRGMEERPRVVDLGCGDFNVGKQIVPLASSYLACDVVEDLIQYNAEHYSNLKNLEFRVVDLTADPIPIADVLIVRQVLQHLSNQSISKFCKKIPTEYKYLLITEHVPDFAGFKPNKDKPDGEWTRVRLDSGVVLTESPFHLPVKSQQLLCTTQDYRGIAQTIAYEL